MGARETTPHHQKQDRESTIAELEMESYTRRVTRISDCLLSLFHCSRAKSNPRQDSHSLCRDFCRESPKVDAAVL